jgi:hypothetical protein
MSVPLGSAAARQVTPGRVWEDDGALLKRFVFLLGAERVVPTHRECHLYELLRASDTVGRELTNQAPSILRPSSRVAWSAKPWAKHAHFDSAIIVKPYAQQVTSMSSIAITGTLVAPPELKGARTLVSFQ